MEIEIGRIPQSKSSQSWVRNGQAAPLRAMRHCDGLIALAFAFAPTWDLIRYVQRWPLAAAQHRLPDYHHAMLAPQFAAAHCFHSCMDVISGPARLLAGALDALTLAHRKIFILLSRA